MSWPRWPARTPRPMTLGPASSTRPRARGPEPKLIQPPFIPVLPIDNWPLVKHHPADPKVCEAFDGIVAGLEILGGGTEIHHPVEQRERFVGQRERQESGAEEDPHPTDEEFVRALEYGMPPASGVGLRIARPTVLMA